MTRLLFSVALTFQLGTCFAQTPEELNQLSKELLAKNDIARALPVLKKAADGGIAEAEYNYGICFQQGVGVTQDDNTANSWFLKSARQGNVDAQFKIAYSYSTGRGYAKDEKQSFYWSVKCAQQNDPSCMFNVIGCYKNGIGTTRNVDSMLTWAIRLASLPDADDVQQSGNITSARLNLAILYRDGIEIKKDIRKSYMWLLIYNETKRDFSITEQQRGIDIIQSIEKELTEKDKANAKLAAARQLGHELRKLDNLYKVDIN